MKPQDEKIYQEEMSFQQDGAPPHFTNKTIQLLKEKSNSPFVVRNGDVDLPLR